ncbi:MAG: HYR domain-containing protein, partial [Thaumarchaeota archaeon]|nr:HYR domain-containing protein [Nitrososphaerota archaeon]
SLCEIDLNDCAPIKLKFWIKGDIQHETELLCDVKVAVFDGKKIIIGSMGLGKTSPEPITFDDDLFHYAIAFKSSLAWLGAFATGNEGDRIHGPQAFNLPAWGKIGAIGGAQLIPIREETIIVPAGTVDTVVVGWYSGDWNEIWIVDDFPFPVKAITYTWITTGIPPIMHQYTLLDYEENVSSDPFSNVIPTEPEPTPDPTPDPTNDAEVSVLITDKNTYQKSESIIFSGFIDGLSDGQDVRVNLIIRDPSGNILEPKGTFSNIVSDDDFDPLLHTSLFSVDGIYAATAYIQSESFGASTNFGFFADGTIPEPEPEPTPEPNEDTIPQEILIPTDMLLSINNPDGLNVEFIVKAIDNVDQIITPTCSPSSGSFFPIGETTVECTAIDSAGNTSDKSFTVTVELKDFDVPIWVKDVAGFWCNDEIDNGAFIQALQYLVTTEVIVIPTTESSSEETQDIPDWIKNNACWWSQGIITDGDFVNAIQYLISKGIVSV